MTTNNRQLAWILIVCGLVAVWAAFTLTLDKITLLENPEAELPCNINPLISCGPVILTSQASAFGVPNPMLGLIGYSFIVMTGIMLLAGAIPSRKFWKLFLTGLILAEVFIHWLIFQSVYRIGNLCLYCMITWAVTWPIFVYIISHIWPESWVARNKWATIIGWYLLIILIILSHFRDFFFG